MTVSSSTNRNDYAGNGSTTSFAVSFRFLQNSDVKATLRDASGGETLQVETTNYTLSGAGDAGGGTLVMLVPPPSGETLTILRDVPATQETDYVENDEFPAESHEDALDKLTMLVQQLSEDSTRHIGFSDTVSDATGTAVELSQNAAQRADKFLGFDSSGNVVTKTASSAGLVDQGLQDKRYAPIFATVAAAKAANPVSIDADTVNLVSGMVVETRGFYDGWAASLEPQGAGRYVVATLADVRAAKSLPAWVPDEKGDHTAANGLVLMLQHFGRVNVKTFGAVGNGVTDDLAAVQSALYRRFEGGRTFNGKTALTVEADGDFKCSGPLFIPPNAKFLGTGAQFSRFLFDDATSGFVGFDNATNGDTGHPDYVGGGTQFFSVENVWIDSPTQTASTRGIDFDDVFFGSFKDCLVTGFDVGGYYEGQVSEMLNTRFGTWGTTGLNVQGQSVTLNTITVEKPFNHAVSIAGTTGVIVGGVATTNGIVFNNLHIEDMERGVDIVDADGVVINGIRCSNGTASTGTDCVRLQAGSLALNGLSSFDYTNQITNTHNTGMSITGTNFVPFWTYGNNAVSGKYDILFDLVKAIGGSSGGFRVGDTAKLIGQDAQGNLELHFGTSGSVKQLQVKPGGGSTTLFMDANGDIITSGGISGNGATFSRNLADRQAVTTSASSQAITFPKTEPNANYKVVLTPNWNTTFWLTSISTGGFTANFGTVAPGGAEVHWHLIG